MHIVHLLCSSHRDFSKFLKETHSTSMAVAFNKLLTLLSCRRPVILGLHSVALPLEHVRLSGTCWILIQMVEWTRLVASLCLVASPKTASVLAPKLSCLFRRLLVVSFR